MKDVKAYRVEVLGNIWQPGAGLCSYVYTMVQDHEPTPEEITRKAGDFECVTDYRLMRYEPCPTCGHEEPLIIRDWKLPESADSWADLAADE